MKKFEEVLGEKKVLILHDRLSEPPTPDESDITDTVAWITEMLESFGSVTKSFSFLLDLDEMRQKILAEKPFLVFNVVDVIGGTARLGYLSPSLLEVLNIPYTGCRTNAMFLASDKTMAKKIMSYNDITTANWTLDGLGINSGTYIVKSAYEHASIGLENSNIVNAKDVKEKILERTKTMGGKWFAEKYIEGREFSVPLLEIDGEMRLLPPYEICYPNYPADKKPIQDYSAKWDVESFGFTSSYREFDFPESDAKLIARVKAEAKKCSDAFGLSGYARIDMRIDGDIPSVIDVNANSALDPEIGFAISAGKAGIDHQDIIGNIALAALKENMKC